MLWLECKLKIFLSLVVILYIIGYRGNIFVSLNVLVFVVLVFLLYGIRC